MVIGTCALPPFDVACPIFVTRPRTVAPEGITTGTCAPTWVRLCCPAGTSTVTTSVVEVAVITGLAPPVAGPVSAVAEGREGDDDFLDGRVLAAETSRWRRWFWRSSWRIALPSLEMALASVPACRLRVAGGAAVV